MENRSSAEIEFFESKPWLRWLKLREKNYYELTKEERVEYRKLELVVCRELTKLQPYIIPRPRTIRKKGSELAPKLGLLRAEPPQKNTLP